MRHFLRKSRVFDGQFDDGGFGQAGGRQGGQRLGVEELNGDNVRTTCSILHLGRVHIFGELGRNIGLISFSRMIRNSMTTKDDLIGGAVDLSLGRHC